jgi:hypothetical protein
MINTLYNNTWFGYKVQEQHLPFFHTTLKDKNGGGGLIHATYECAEKELFDFRIVRKWILFQWYNMQIWLLAVKRHLSLILLMQRSCSRSMSARFQYQEQRWTNIKQGHPYVKPFICSLTQPVEQAVRKLNVLMWRCGPRTMECTKKKKKTPPLPLEGYYATAYLSSHASQQAPLKKQQPLITA